MPELAGVLADLVGRASTDLVGGFFGAPPDWAGWDRADQAAGVWPNAGPGEVDLNATPEPGWLTEVVAATGRRLWGTVLPGVVGHVDWEPPNLGWTGPVITAVYDWDSLTVLSEAAVAGLAAAVHPVVDDGPGATVEQTAVFLGACADARGRPWTAEEEQVAWAADLWVSSYNAKGEAVDGSTARSPNACRPDSATVALRPASAPLRPCDHGPSRGRADAGPRGSPDARRAETGRRPARPPWLACWDVVDVRGRELPVVAPVGDRTGPGDGGDRRERHRQVQRVPGAAAAGGGVP